MIAETPRLILRELEPADAPALHAVFSQPEAIRFALRVHANVGETRNWVTAVQNGYVKNGFGPWAIILKDDGSVIGYSGCSLIKVDGQWEHELGYRVLPSHWGRGYATEATAAARDYGFDHLDFSRLVAVIQTGNAASVRVAEKIGMAYEKDIVFENMPASLFAVRKGKKGEPAHAAD